MTQSIAMRNKMGDMMPPCLTFEFTVNQSVTLLLSRTANSNFVEAFHGDHYFIWYTIGFNYFRKNVAVNAVEALFDMNKINVERCFPFY